MEVQSPFQIAIFLYPGVTVLDAAGPFEVLSHMPATEVRFVAKETGPITTEGGILLLGATHTMAETTSPDLVIVPGGTTTPGQMVDDEVLEWLRNVHETSVLDHIYLHWFSHPGCCRHFERHACYDALDQKSVLKTMGSKPQPDERIVRCGKIVTGVSAGTDLGL